MLRTDRRFSQSILTSNVVQLIEIFQSPAGSHFYSDELMARRSGHSLVLRLFFSKLMLAFKVELEKLPQTSFADLFFLQKSLNFEAIVKIK